MFGRQHKLVMPDESTALPGRSTPMAVSPVHFVTGASIIEPFPPGSRLAMFGMGCFWGAERMFWKLDGVIATMVGYAAGLTPNPNYREVCSGLTGHNEVVRVVYDPARISYEQLLRTFWEGHNPTQGMRQGNDVGTQYRSGIYTYGEEQHAAGLASLSQYQERLRAAGLGEITTEILAAPSFYYAEPDHQQYLGKNPGGYCGLGGTGVSCPIGSGVAL